MNLLPSYLRTRRAPERSLAAAPSSSDSLGRGMDVALTLLVFLGIGWAIDAWLGIFPLFTIGLVVFSAVGMFLRLKFTYDATMERLEADLLAGRRTPGASMSASSATGALDGTMEGAA